MIPNANARHFRIKAAQRDLIAHCGGIERCVALSGYSKSQVGRWNHADSPDLMPTDAIYLLENECGELHVTAAMAEVHGRRLSDHEGMTKDAGDITARFADVLGKVGELSVVAATAFADGRVTNNEADAIYKGAAALKQVCADLMKASAVVRGEGGLSLVKDSAA